MSEVRSYYGQPVIKEPVWKPEIPWYFFTGGLAGASAGLAWLAERAGDDELARRAWAVSLAGATTSPVLLISDLGVPSRFLNMLRMFKVTSPMSVGAWNLTFSGTATALAAGSAWTGLFPRAGAAAKGAAALLGLPLSTYTAALIAQTAVPVWHEARRDLPFVFAASSAASAGAAAQLVSSAPAARRVTLLGAGSTLAGLQAMEHRLGSLGEPYRSGPAGSYGRAAKALTAAGAALTAAPRRALQIAGGALVLGGVVCERWSIFKAGFQSASDPKYTVGPQRERVSSAH